MATYTVELLKVDAQPNETNETRVKTLGTFEQYDETLDAVRNDLQVFFAENAAQGEIADKGLIDYVVESFALFNAGRFFVNGQLYRYRVAS